MKTIFNKRFVKNALISALATFLYMSYLMYREYNFSQYELAASVPFTSRAEIGKIYAKSSFVNLRIVVLQDEFTWAKFLITEQKDVPLEQVKEKLQSFLTGYYSSSTFTDYYINRVKEDLAKQKLQLQNYQEQCSLLEKKYSFDKESFVLCGNNIIETELSILNFSASLESLKQKKQPLVLEVRQLSSSMDNKPLVILCIFCWLVSMFSLTIINLAKNNE